MNIDRAVIILKMMSNPIRLRILKFLVEKDCETCVGRMEEVLEIPQSSVSQHLAHLRNCGILVAKKRGKKVCYEILDEAVINVLKSLEISE